MAQALVRPSRAFENLRENPRWVWPFILVLGAGMLLAVTAVVTPAGLEAQLAALEAQREDLGEENYQQAIEQLNSPLVRTITLVTAVVATLVGGAVIFVLTAGVYHLIASALGGRGTAVFRVALAVVGYAALPSVARNLIATAIILAGGAVPAAGLSALLPADQAATPIGVLLGRVDLFVLWGIVIAIVALATAYRISRGKAAVVVIGWWALGTLVVVGLTALGTALISGASG